MGYVSATVTEDEKQLKATCRGVNDVRSDVIFSLTPSPFQDVPEELTLMVGFKTTHLSIEQVKEYRSLFDRFLTIHDTQAEVSDER